MGKGNSLSAGYLALLFNATTLPNIAINATSAPLTNLYVSLHTANPGAAGTQSSSEAAYVGYARVPVVRSSAGWTLSGETIFPVSPIVFPTSTGGTETETYFGIGSAASGAGVLYYSGTLTPPVVVSNGIAPDITTATMITEA